MPTTAEVNAAAENFIADTETADSKINGAPGDVTDRHGATTPNLEKIFSQIGYKVPVAFASGLTPTSGAFTVMHDGLVYSANPDEVPFTTTATFDPSQWSLVSAPDTAIFLDGKQYQILSCVLRQDSQGSGWYAIDDAGHAPTWLDGTTPVEVSADGHIVLNYAESSQKIGALVPASDEGYANGNLSYGASVGSSAAIIKLYYPFWCRTSGTGITAHSYFGSMASNNTLSDGEWFAEYDVSAGTWEVTHSSESHSDAAGSVITVEKYGEDTNAFDYEITSRMKTGFTVQAMQMIHGETNGGSTILSENVGPSTASWDATANTLTITHPPSPSARDYAVTTNNPMFPVGVSASNTTSMTIKFADVAGGAEYTGSSIPCNVTYLRGGKAPCALTGGSKFKAERLGKCNVNANNVSGGSSNIWVLGYFQVG